MAGEDTGLNSRDADERAIEPLIQFLSGNDVELRRTAATALGRYGDDHTVAALSEAAGRDWDVEVRRAAAESLGRIGAPSAIPALIRALSDRADAVREAAGTALERVGPPAVPPLIESLGYHSVTTRGVTIRCQAASVLGRVADGRAIMPLIEALRVPEYEVSLRRAAAEALGDIAIRHPAPELRNAIPVLRRVGNSGDRLYHQVIRRIEEATKGVRHLPLPAAPPLPTGDDLPLPAGAPKPCYEGLPVPAIPPERSEEQKGAPPTGWCQGARSLLRRWLPLDRTGT